MYNRPSPKQSESVVMIDRTQKAESQELEFATDAFGFPESGTNINDHHVNSFCKRYSEGIWSLFFTLGFVTLVVVAINAWSKMSALYGFFALPFFICSLFNIWYAPTRRYLADILDRQEVQEYAQRMHTIRSVIKWTNTCFHMESSSNSDDNSETKVITFVARKVFEFDSWRDISQDWSKVMNTTSTMNKIEFDKTYQFADAESRKLYDRELELFKQQNKRDVQQEFAEEIEIKGYIADQRVLMVLCISTVGQQAMLLDHVSVGVFLMLSIQTRLCCSVDVV